MFHSAKCGGCPCPTAAPMQMAKKAPAQVAQGRMMAFAGSEIKFLVRSCDNMERILVVWVCYPVWFALQCM